MIPGRKRPAVSWCCYAPAVEEEMMNFRTDAEKPQVKIQIADGVDSVSSYGPGLEWLTSRSLFLSKNILK